MSCCQETLPSTRQSFCSDDVTQCTTLAEDKRSKMTVQSVEVEKIGTLKVQGSAMGAENCEAVCTKKTVDLSRRAEDMLNVVDTATSSLMEVVLDTYCAKTNPKGKINLCTAENTLCIDLIEKKLSDVQLFKPEMSHLFHYPVPGGFERTKDALTSYFATFLNVKLSNNNLILAPGVTGAYDMLAFALCDPGDFVLCPAPYYGRVSNDFKERASIGVLSVTFPDPLNPKLEVSNFEKCYKEQTAKGASIKAVVLINPQNPHGNVFSKEEIIAICNWASSRNLNVIIDEIFASSVYFDENSFESYLAFRNLVNRPDKVFWIWGFSKDLCMPGSKMSVIHSEDAKATECLTRLELLQPVAPLAQDFAVNFLSDLDWLKMYHKENVRRLREQCELAKAALKEMEIPFVACSAGFYIYCCFKEYLSEQTHEAEYSFWRKLCSEGVYISTGKYFADTEPGWFRMVFSCEKATLLEGLKRIKTVLEKIKKERQ